MMGPRLILAHLLDILDVVVLQHRFHRFCELVTWTWPDCAHSRKQCMWCKRFTTDDD